MKKILFLTLICSVMFLGCQGKIHSEDKDLKDIEDWLEGHTKLIMNTGRIGIGATNKFGISGPTLVDQVNVGLLNANLKSSKKLRAAIEKFDTASTVLSIAMIIISAATLIAGIVQVRLMRRERRAIEEYREMRIRPLRPGLLHYSRYYQQKYGRKSSLFNSIRHSRP